METRLPVDSSVGGKTAINAAAGNNVVVGDNATIDWVVDDNDPADIDRLLEKHAALAKRLKRILDLLKPQDKVRIRYQEEGSELDLDVAIRGKLNDLALQAKAVHDITTKDHREMAAALRREYFAGVSSVMLTPVREALEAFLADWAKTGQSIL